MGATSPTKGRNPRAARWRECGADDARRATQEIRHRIAVALHVDVAFDVDQAVMKRVDLGDEERQRLELRAFGDEELARARMQMVFIRGVDFVAPRPRLGIEIGEVRKGPPSEKIGFDEPKRTFHAAGSIGIAFLVGAEGEAKALGEGGHFRRGHHPRARAGGDHDVRVVNHAGRAGAGHVLERVGEKDLAGKSREGRVHLDEEQPRIAQHQRGGLHGLLDAADRRAMRGGVVLHLLAHREVVVAHGRRGRVADPMAAAKRGERGIRERDAGGDQLFMHAHEIAAALLKQGDDLIAVGLGFLGSLKVWHRR
jgi:hypothetical protein